MISIICKWLPLMYYVLGPAGREARHDANAACSPVWVVRDPDSSRACRGIIALKRNAVMMSACGASTGSPHGSLLLATRLGVSRACRDGRLLLTKSRLSGATVRGDTFAVPYPGILAATSDKVPCPCTAAGV